MDQLQKYIEENKQRFLDELFELIRKAYHLPFKNVTFDNFKDVDIDPLNLFESVTAGKQSF